MKRLGAVGFVVCLLAAVAYASEPVMCSLTVTTSAAISTVDAGPGDGGTGSCTWAKGANVLVQCPWISVYMNSSGSSASSSDALADFTVNNDPIPVYLDSNEQVISVKGVSDAGTCKFMTTKRPKPWQAK